MAPSRAGPIAEGLRSISVHLGFLSDERTCKWYRVWDWVSSNTCDQSAPSRVVCRSERDQMEAGMQSVEWLLAASSSFGPFGIDDRRNGAVRNTRKPLHAAPGWGLHIFGGMAKSNRRNEAPSMSQPAQPSDGCLQHTDSLSSSVYSTTG